MGTLTHTCAEKNLAVIKGIMEQVPGSRLAFVGDGPARKELEQIFAGMPVVFMVRHTCVFKGSVNVRVCPLN